MRRQIIRTAEEEKISAVGICTRERYSEEEKRLGKKASFCASGGCPDWVTSIIVCAFSYFSGAEKGNISRYAQGKDYHIVAREKMGKIAEVLKSRGFRAEGFADTGCLNERLLARLSGIAFIGKNQMAISPRFGSYFFIGYILTDCELEPDKENNASCAGCGKCIAACPLGALDDGEFCEEKCLSYITQKKGELSRQEIAAMRASNTIWGCDICQEVCPHNQNLPITEIKEFCENLVLNLKVDEKLSNKEFKKLYSGRAFAWRGKSVLIRNEKAAYNRKEF